MNEVVTFDPAKLKERVSDIVKGTFLDLIPPETFKKMVDTEIAKFFDHASVNVENKKDEYGNSTLKRSESMTPFQELVRGEVQKQIKNKLADVLATDEWGCKYWSSENTSVMASALTKELVPDLVTMMFKGLTQNILHEVHQMLRR